MIIHDRTRLIDGERSVIFMAIKPRESGDFCLWEDFGTRIGACLRVFSVIGFDYSRKIAIFRLFGTRTEAGLLRSPRRFWGRRAPKIAGRCTAKKANLINSSAPLPALVIEGNMRFADFRAILGASSPQNRGERSRKSFSGGFSGAFPSCAYRLTALRSQRRVSSRNKSSPADLARELKLCDYSVVD